MTSSLVGMDAVAPSLDTAMAAAFAAVSSPAGAGIWAIGNILYDLLWNEKERKAQYGKTLDKEKMTERLKQCILLSHFCKQSYEEKFYYDKLCEG